MDAYSDQRQVEPPAAGVAAYLALGSNLGDREANLRAAVDALAQLPEVTGLSVSRFYETDPVGPQDQGRFLNAAAAVTTTLSPRALLDALLLIEAALGRAPRAERRPWGPREIDLDLLFYGQAVIDKPDLTVPHPRLHERAFVLRPLGDLAPDLRHPVLGQTVQELLDAIEHPAEAAS